MLSDTAPANQWIEYDWSDQGTIHVQGVLFYTREDLMTSGTIKFYVDDVECPDTSGVGVNAIGGVFNCDLEGTIFTAVCEGTCSPYFAVQELQLWRDEIVSHTGTPYRLAGNVDSPYANDADKVFETGSYFGT